MSRVYPPPCQHRAPSQSQLAAARCTHAAEVGVQCGATGAAASLLCARRVSTATGPNRQDAANAVPDDGSAAGGPARPRREAARGRHAASRLLLGTLPLARAGGGHLSGAERGHPKEPAPQWHGRRCRHPGHGRHRPSPGGSGHQPAAAHAAPRVRLVSAAACRRPLRVGPRSRRRAAIRRAARGGGDTTRPRTDDARHDRLL